MILNPEMRLNSPPLGLLEEAAKAYLRVAGLSTDTALEWSVGGRIEGASSTVLRLSLGVDGRQVPIYVKQFHPPPGDDQGKWARKYRTGVERSVQLSNRICGMGEIEGIAIARTLAADPERLLTVNTGVAGRPLGKAWRSLWRDPQATRYTYWHIGRSIALVERASLGEAADTGYLDRFATEERRRLIPTCFDQAETDRLGVLLGSLHRQFSERAARSFYYCHGDINHSNVLLDRGQVSLIDFGWAARPVAFDLCLFLLRLETERPRVEFHTQRLIQWVLEGYGSPQVRGSPGFTLVRFWKLFELIAHLEKSGKSTQLRRAVSLVRRYADEV